MHYGALRVKGGYLSHLRKVCLVGGKPALANKKCQWSMLDPPYIETPWTSNTTLSVPYLPFHVAPDHEHRLWAHAETALRVLCLAADGVAMGESHGPNEGRCCRIRRGGALAAVVAVLAFTSKVSAFVPLSFSVRGE